MYAKICVQVSTFRNGADFAPGHVRSTQSIKILKESQMPLMSKQNVIYILWAVSSSWHKTIKYTTRKTLKKKKSQKKRRNRKLLLLLLSALYLPFLSSFLTDHSLPLSLLCSLSQVPCSCSWFMGFVFNFHLFFWVCLFFYFRPFLGLWRVSCKK